MRPGGTRSRGRGVYGLAAALTVAIGAAIATVTGVDVTLAGRLVAENGPVEWLQVVLFTGAALITARLAAFERAEGRSGAPDVLLTAGFAFLVVSEMELPRLILGKSIKIGRLARDVAAGSPRESVFVLVTGGLAVGLAAYALRHRAELVAWSWSALETPWGRLLLLGGTILVLTEVFERSLNRMMMASTRPRTLLEETLELLASLYCLLAMMQRRSGSYR